MRRALVGLMAVLAFGTAPVRAARTALLDLVSAQPPRVELAGVERPVLAFGPSGSARLATGAGTVPVKGILPIPIVLPAGWTFDAVDATALVIVGGEGRELPALVLPGKPPQAVFRFEPSEAGAPARWTIFGQVRPRTGALRRTIGPLAWPGGARLRARVGIAPDACATMPPAILRVVVVEEHHGRTLLRRRLDPAADCDHWTEIAAPLGPHPARAARIRFVVRAARPADRARVLSPAIATPIVDDDVGPGARPNVVLVSLDTLGARHLGTYGSARPTSPGLDRLAARGTLFEHVEAQYPSTAASHMSLFTGHVVAAHGVRGYLDTLAADVDTLSQAMHRAGYTTAAFTEDGLVSRRLGFARGFDHYRENPDPVPSRRRGQARATFGSALRWLGAEATEPFFLFVHTYEVHAPYRPAPSHLAAIGAGDPATAEERYDAEVHGVDELLARFLRGVAMHDRARQTIVVVTADHGEAFGEHGHYAHGRCLHEDVLHVPLVLVGPGIPRGLRVPTRVGLLDVAPTILDLVAAPPMPGIDGRSLAAALRGGDLSERPVFSEVRGPMGPIAGKVDPDQRAAWIGRAKVIHDVGTGATWFYDLDVDPAENDSVLPDPAVFARLRDALAAYARVTMVGAAPPTGDAAPSPEVVEHMRALGYVE